MESDSFYLILPSNSLVNNRTGNYTVILPSEINLYGEWECALTELVYPYTWINVPEKIEQTSQYFFNQFNIQYSNEKQGKFFIQHGNYDNVQKLVDALNDPLDVQYTTSKYIPIKNIERTDCI